MSPSKGKTEGLGELEIPGPFLRALTTNTYQQVGKYSVTGLISPPQLRQLYRRHGKDIVRQPEDNFFSFLGTAFHSAVEAFTNEGWEVAEERMIEVVDGVEISAKPDLLTLKGGVLYDYKLTSVWVSKTGAKDEWVEQTNCYRWFMARRGFEVNRIAICAAYRDWSKSSWKRDPDNYPSKPFELHPIPVWSLEEAEAFIRERVRMQEEADALPDDQLPPCGPKDRWAGDPWAVRRYGAKNPTKRFATEGEAELFRAEKERTGRGSYVIEYAPEAPRRCADYCDVRDFCWQFAREKGEPVATSQS